MITNSSSDPSNLTGVDEDKLFAALSYVGVLVLIPLLIKRHRPFVVWHAKQGLVLLAGFIIAGMATTWTPAIGSLLFLFCLIVDIIALVQALLGRRWKIPVVGALADKFNI